jgi:hypothetical protein
VHAHLIAASAIGGGLTPSGKLAPYQERYCAIQPVRIHTSGRQECETFEAGVQMEI